MKRTPQNYSAATCIQYFQDRVIIDPATGCWNWQKAISRNGYGVLNYSGKARRAHRHAYVIANKLESVPRHLDVCHKCDNRKCVNPDHLFVGTRSDNMIDALKKGRLKTPNLAGEKCPASKLSISQVQDIRVDGRSFRSLARAYGVDKGTIAAIVKRTSWRSV